MVGNVGAGLQPSLTFHTQLTARFLLGSCIRRRKALMSDNSTSAVRLSGFGLSHRMLGVAYIYSRQPLRIL
jgi:hypothetical protein